MTSKSEKDKAAKAEAEEAKAQAEDAEEEQSEQNVHGPVATPPEPAPEVEPQRAGATSDEPVLSQYNIDDGVEDSELGPPVLGGWVQIKDGGDYDGHYAAYLGNLDYDKDGNPKMIQVRTRDADNMILAIPYDEVTSTTYSGGR